MRAVLFLSIFAASVIALPASWSDSVSVSEKRADEVHDPTVIIARALRRENTQSEEIHDPDAIIA